MKKTDDIPVGAREHYKNIQRRRRWRIASVCVCVVGTIVFAAYLEQVQGVVCCSCFVLPALAWYLAVERASQQSFYSGGIIDQMLAERTCPSCEYNLRDIKVDGSIVQCPECGSTWDYSRKYADGSDSNSKPS